MEHNFNPNKGDFKYILEEERLKQTGEALTPPVSGKQKLYDRFCNWIIIRLTKLLERLDQIKIPSTLFLFAKWCTFITCHILYYNNLKHKK